MTDERKKAVMAFGMRRIVSLSDEDWSELINLASTQCPGFLNGMNKLKCLGGFNNFLMCCAQDLEEPSRKVSTMAVAFTARKSTLRPQMTQATFDWLEGMLGPPRWYRTYHHRDRGANAAILLNWKTPRRADALLELTCKK